MKQKRILVTGSAGLLGTAIKKILKEDVYFATREDADLTNYEATKALFRFVKPTHVINLAAAVGGIGGNMQHSGEYFRNNVMMNINVLEAAREAKVDKLISYMSTCVFPDKTEYPLRVENLHNGAPHPSNFGYAYAKRMLEVQSSAYRQEWNCNYIVLIPTNMYGSNDNWSIQNGHVIPSLIHKIYHAKKDKKPLKVWGSGKPLREFVYAKDIAKLSVWALDNYNSDKPLILSSGIEITIKDLVVKVANIMEFKQSIIFDADKPDGQYRKPSDTTELAKLLPNFKWTPIDKGLDETIKWFLKKYPNVRIYDK